MNGYEHIVTLYSAGWFGWTMLVLAVCAVLSELFQPGVITGVPSQVFAHSERTYKQTPDNFPGQLTVTVFRLGTPALLLMMIMGDRFASPGNGFALYGISIAMILVVMLVKMLCNALVDYTFSLRANAAGMTDMYANIATFMGLLLYPAILLLPFIGSVAVNRWVAGVAAALFVGLITYRLMRTYMTSARSIFYILMYVFTLELLPLGVLVVGMSQMMKLI